MMLDWAKFVRRHVNSLSQASFLFVPIISPNKCKIAQITALPAPYPKSDHGASSGSESRLLRDAWRGACQTFQSGRHPLAKIGDESPVDCAKDPSRALIGVKTRSSGARLMVKWSLDSCRSLDPSSPGARLTLYSVNSLVVSVRSSVKAMFLPMQLYGPDKKGTKAFLCFTSSGRLYQRSGMKESASA